MVEDTLKALELGAVEDLIIWDNLETNRYVLRNSQSGEETVTYMTKEQEGVGDSEVLSSFRERTMDGRSKLDASRR